MAESKVNRCERGGAMSAVGSNEAAGRNQVQNFIL